MLSTLERRAREVFEHKPRELRVAVNGHLMGALAVNSDRNEIGLAVSDKEPIEFLEVFSEQQVRLLILDLEYSHDGPNPTVQRSVSLSDSRKIELNVEFVARGAEVRLSYDDPTFAEVRSLVDFEIDDEAAVAPPATGDHTAGVDGYLPRIITFPVFASLRNLIPSWRYSAFASILLLTAFGFLFVGDRTSNSSAKAVLEEAEKKKLNWQFQPGKILYLEEEEKLQNSDEVYRSKRWTSNLNGGHEWVKVRFDSKGQMSFGKWVKPSGQVIIYHGAPADMVSIYPSSAQILARINDLDADRKQALARYLADSERSVSSDQQATLHTSWLLDHIASQSTKTIGRADGKDVLEIRVTSDLSERGGNATSGSLEVDYDKETYQRLLYRMSYARKDGTKSLEETRLVTARESSLEEFDGNELAKLLAAGKKTRIIAVEDFADQMKRFYQPKTSPQQ